MQLADIGISGVGFHVPEREVHNEDLIRNLETSDDWIQRNLGIARRRMIDPASESALQLATVASRMAIQNAALTASDLSGVVVATASPPLRAPSTACQLAGELGIDTGAFAFDVQAVCSGFLYALTLAGSMLTSIGKGHVLVVGTDTFSEILDLEHRNSVFFGDGAGAAILSRDEMTLGGKFVSEIKADGRDAEGFSAAWGQPFQMQPKEVYRHATNVLPKVIREVLDAADVPIDDVDYIVPHQPSLRVLQALSEDLGISDHKVLKNMDRYANTAGASIPILLAENAQAGTFKPGMNLLFAAVGAGWTWGATLITWDGLRGD